MNENRRTFLKQSSAGMMLSALPMALPLATLGYPRPVENKVSLATWSLVRSFRQGVWKLADIPRICREDFGIDGIEYVNQFFEVPNANYLNTLNKAAKDHGVENVLIMVDGEGSMVAKEKSARMQSAVNHRKWIDIAAYLGCHAIRCNAHGGGETPDEDPDAIKRAAESFSAVLEYAKEFKINVIIENHGGLSSHPTWLPQLAKELGGENFGLLPDYGNYHPIEGYDVYKCVEMAMPYAKGVSVKAGFKPDGTHAQYDIEKLLKISLDSGFSGYWGIESGMRRTGASMVNTAEAAKADDWQAVKWTKAKIDKVVFGK